MSRAPGTISRWLLATNLFLPSRCLWRSGRVILTSPSLFVLLSFCFCSVFVAKPGKTSSSSTFPLPPLMKPIWGEITKWNCQTHNRVNFLQYDICILIARDIFVHPAPLEKHTLQVCPRRFYIFAPSTFMGVLEAWLKESYRRSDFWLLLPPLAVPPSLNQEAGIRRKNPSVNMTAHSLSRIHQ